MRHYVSGSMDIDRLRKVTSQADEPRYSFECFECRHEFELDAPYLSHAICPNCGSYKIFSVDEPRRNRR